MVTTFFFFGEVFVAFIVLDKRAWMRTLFWIWNLSSNRTCFACLMFDFFGVYVCQSVWSHLATGSPWVYLTGQERSTAATVNSYTFVACECAEATPPPKLDQFLKASCHGRIAFHHICWLGMLFSFQARRVNSSGLFFFHVFCFVSADFLSLNNPYVIIFYVAIVWVVTTLKIVTAQWRLSHNIPSLGPTLCMIVGLFTHNCKGDSSFCAVINVTVHGMRRTLCREFCRKLVHWREQSVEMCDLYSVAPNAFVLFRSYIGSAALSFFPLHLRLSPSPRRITWCIEISVERPL